MRGQPIVAARPIRRRARAVAIAVSVSLGAAAALACASSDARLRREAPDLVVGRWQEDALHCSDGRCAVLYRLAVEKPATWVVEADSPADPLLPDFYLVLEDDAGRPVGDDREAQKRPRRVVRPLEPGLYYVRVAGQARRGDRLSFKLKAQEQTKRAKRPAKRRSRPAAAAPPPPPAPVVVETEVLEVERDGGEPVAVLIEAGTSAGLAPGHTGELVEDGHVIGRLEIVDVYAAGSRARIVGGLRAPITLDTRVRIEK